MSRTAGTVVDSSVLLDIFTEDEVWLRWSREHLIEAAHRGPLVLNAVVIAEISPRFSRIEDVRASLPPSCLIEALPFAASFLAGYVSAEFGGHVVATGVS